MKILDATPAPARADRPATCVLHDEPSLRVVAFLLLPGQAVPPHRSTSTVLVQVVAGTGRFTGDGGEATLSPGGAAVYAPGETHSITALDEELRFHAVITPRPG